MITLSAGVVIAGRYELTRPLARGGMGSVWIARHRELDVLVAVKFMDHALIAEGDARARFEREAKAAAHIDSRHVVQVHDYGVENHTPYIVMEFLKGEDLANRLKRDLRLSPSAMATVLTQAAKALRKAHEAGIVHRDLKPANIFLAQKDEEEVVKVLDFGIAKAIGVGLAGEVTKTGTLIGSVHFMSPEQARGSKNVDHRSDLWSLAVIVFRALTGKLPFAGHDIGDVIVKICADPVPLASQLAPGLPRDVDRFFERGLARDLGRRFQSAREMAEAFHTLANGARPLTEHGASEALRMGSGDWAFERAEALAKSPAVAASSGDRPSTEVSTVELHLGSLRAPGAELSPPADRSHSAPSFSGAPLGTLTPTHETLSSPGASHRRIIAVATVGGAVAVSLAAVLMLSATFTRGKKQSIAGVEVTTSATAPFIDVQPPTPQAQPPPTQVQPPPPEVQPAPLEVQPSAPEVQLTAPVVSPAIVVLSDAKAATVASLSSPPPTTTAPSAKKTKQPSSAVSAQPVGAMPSQPPTTASPTPQETKIDLP